MKRAAWSQTVSGDVAARRAGGRRRYNAVRKRQARQRASDAYVLWRAGGKPCQIARWLGVSRFAVWRYLRPHRTEELLAFFPPGSDPDLLLFALRVLPTVLPRCRACATAIEAALWEA